MKLKVYATHPNSLNIKHPIDGPLVVAGSYWEDDGFTARMMSDGAVTIDPPPHAPIDPATLPPKK